MSTNITRSPHFAAAHSIVIKQIAGFQDLGDALADIRDNKLYLEEFDSFEKYVRHYCDVSKSRAYQLIEAANIAREASTIVDITKESHARALSKVPPKDRISTMKKVVSSGQPITVKSIQAAATPKPSPNQPPPSILQPPKSDPSTSHPLIQIIDSWWASYSLPLQYIPNPPAPKVVQALKDFILTHH